MSYRAKKLTDDNFPDTWTVEIIYRDGSSPTTYPERSFLAGKSMSI